jgi:archaellum component FlaC
MMEVTIALVSGLSSAGFMAVVVLMLLRGRLAEVPELRRDVRDLGEKRVTRAEKDIEDVRKTMEEHKSRDCTQRIETKLEIIEAQNNQILLKVGHLDRETGEQKAQISEVSDHLSRLHEDFSRHKREDHRPHA